MKKHSKGLMFFAVSKQIPVVYSADRGRAEIIDIQLISLIRQRKNTIANKSLLGNILLNFEVFIQDPSTNKAVLDNLKPNRFIHSHILRKTSCEVQN